MGYPSIETVQMFAEIINRDGFEEISENLLLKKADPKMMPILSFFKSVLLKMLENDLYEEADGYSSGFLACLDLFRRQIESEKITIEEIETQLENMLGWCQYLEDEGLSLRNELIELTRKYKELQAVPVVQSDANFTNPT